MNDTAAAGFSGSSGALLHYYTALNLAKAYLYPHAPQIVANKIHHGLSYSPSSARTHGADYVTVRPGVFPLLYERYTGQAIPPNTKLKISSLLRQLPEISAEVSGVGWKACQSAAVLHTVAMDRGAQESWSVLAISDFAGCLRTPNQSALMHLKRSFQEVDRPVGWREIFGLSPRTAIAGHLVFFQSREVVPGPMDPASISRLAFQQLTPYFEPAFDGSLRDGMFSKSLTGGPLPMPPSLARYAAIFYLSSLVRYRPEWLDPYSHGEFAWLYDALADNTPLRMLAAFFDLITGQTHRFDPAGFGT